LAHLIHIGKCGGSTVKDELRLNQISFEESHVCEVKYNPTKNYIIIIRNPIQRFISAFYWRYHLVCDSKVQENRFNGEKKLLEKYITVDLLAKDLEYNKNIFTGDINKTYPQEEINSNGNYIHHLKEDINYYLESFIDQCPKEKIVGVICTETLSHDMKLLFDINIQKHEKNNKKYDKTITESSYKILKKYLVKDYQIIKKLFDKGCINEDKFKFLYA
jgi:hypothetical protein